LTKDKYQSGVASGFLARRNRRFGLRFLGRNPKNQEVARLLYIQ
jgi:hypothetical protein